MTFSVYAPEQNCAKCGKPIFPLNSMEGVGGMGMAGSGLYHIGCMPKIETQQDVIDRYKPALILARDTLRHAKVFISTREKMHPDGQALYQEALEAVEAALQ